MTTKMVRYTKETMPKPTEADLARLRENVPDSEIDLSDIPEMTGKNLVRGRFYRPVKEVVTARIDSDVIAWLKEQGDGYQTRMNAILRREFLASKSA